MKYPLKRIHTQLVKTATGYVEAYFDDITVHDLDYLREYKPKRFLWSIRPYGSNLASLDMRFWQEDVLAIDRMYEWVKIMHLEDNKRFFIYDGTLREITKDEALFELDVVYAEVKKYATTVIPDDKMGIDCRFNADLAYMKD